MKRWRITALIAASAVLHGILLSLMGRLVPALRPLPVASGPVIDVTLLHPKGRPAAALGSDAAPLRAAVASPTATPKPAAPAPSAAETVEARPAADQAQASVPPSCAKEVLVLLTPEERRTCELRAAAASALARRGFRPDGAIQDLSRVPLDRRLEFDAQVEAKRNRRDMTRAERELAEAESERARRAPKAWTGQGQGAEASVRVDCSLKFSGWKPVGKLGCRVSGSASSGP